MRIIGHRGAAGLALENTRESLQKALEFDVVGVEFDIRVTKDRKFVLCHDPDLRRVSMSDWNVGEHTLEQLRGIEMLNGESITTLEEALDILKDTWAIVEAKDGGCAKELVAVLDKYKSRKITVASFNHQLAGELEALRPQLSVYLAEHTQPFEIIRLIRTAKADGMDLNAWLLNPLTYWLAKRHGFEIMVYTFNSRFLAWFIHWLYPTAAIVTDRPDRFKPRSGKTTGWSSTKR